MEASQNKTERAPVFHVLFSSMKMATATFSSRILGLVRELAMAAIFGASGITDAFLVAYRIPNVLRDLFAEGAFSSAFVPIFTEVKQKDPTEARKLLWSLFILLGIITSVLALLMAIFAPQLIEIFTDAKFTADSDRFNTTVALLRIMSPFLVLISIAALFMGALNSMKIFFVPALAPAFFNVIMICSIVFLAPVFEKQGIRPIFALGFGVICGGLIQAFIQVPLLIRKSFGPIGPLKLMSVHTKRVVGRLGIGTIGIAATQINILVNTIIATGTVVGAVSWLTYAFRLFQFPVGILGVSIAGSNLVHFSDAWKSGDRDRAVQYLQSSYILALLVIIPATALLFAMSFESVNLVLERGAFTRSDTVMTALALRYYVLGLPFYGLYKIFAPTFYALDKPQIPVAISALTVAINIAFCLTLTPFYGFKILALGVSLSMFINVILQSFYIKKLLKLKFSFFVNLRVMKTIFAGAVSLVVTRYFCGVFCNVDAFFFKKALYFSLTGVIGAFSYVFLVMILGEFSTFKRAVFRK